jgi:heme-degrading monooxygenase HmoA
MMFARHLTTEVYKEKIEEALKIYEESVIPEGKTQEGYRGIYLLTNKETGKIISISFWDSEAHAIKNENSGYFRQQVAKFNGMLISPPVKEGFEVSIMLSKPK